MCELQTQEDLVSILALPLIICGIMASHLTSLQLSFLICKTGLPFTPVV